jgi:hypothetical protein
MSKISINIKMRLLCQIKIFLPGLGREPSIYLLISFNYLSLHHWATELLGYHWTFHKPFYKLHHPLDGVTNPKLRCLWHNNDCSRVFFKWRSYDWYQPCPQIDCLAGVQFQQTLELFTQIHRYLREVRRFKAKIHINQTRVQY